MRQGSIRLGRIMGVPLAMDLGVLLIGGLLTWTLATIVLPSSSPGLQSAAYWSVGAIGALLFLGSLLAHEMAHSLVARRNDVKVQGITLWMFGGYAQFESDPATPGAEFRITAAGPATSLGLALGFAGVAWGLATAGVPQVYVSLMAWLAFINGFLGVFNLLPGAPLDGGRILAAGLWKLRGDRVAGRIGAATAGKFVGLALIGVGVFESLALGGLSGIWTVLIGWFLFNSARTEHAFFSSERAMGDMTVAEAMTPDPHRVASWISVADLVDGPFRHTHQSAVAVTDGQGRAVGIVTMQDVRRLPAEQWATTTAGQLMAAGVSPATAAPGDRLADVVEHMDPANGGYAVVIAEGALIGLLGPDEVRRAIEFGRPGGQRPSAGQRPHGNGSHGNGSHGNGSHGRSPQEGSPPPPPPAVPSQRWDPPVTTP
jgi:Zn-dependent protease/CBS domain-containing protein